MPIQRQLAIDTSALTRARIHHKVVGNFGSEANVQSPYFRRWSLLLKFATRYAQAQITLVAVISKMSKPLPKGFYACAYLLFTSTTKMAATTKCFCPVVFSGAEIDVKLTEIRTHRALLLLKLQNCVTGRRVARSPGRQQRVLLGRAEWSGEIYQNGVERSSRMEWRDLKSEVLVQKLQATKTGGQPPQKESPFQMSCWRFLSKIHHCSLMWQVRYLLTFNRLLVLRRRKTIVKISHQILCVHVHVC